MNISIFALIFAPNKSKSCFRMVKYALSIPIICCLFWGHCLAQNDKSYLFKVDGQEVPISEFEYIYGKTGGDEATYDESSLREYLDLYINFKLKVQKAREMRLDTIAALNRELAGYRRQLADSYLMDQEVTDKLIEEAYTRQQEDVDISHILIKLAPGADAVAEQAALEKIATAKKRIEKGEIFEEVALAMSDDPSVKSNKGRIGFVTALFPNGFYDLETAAYRQPIGEVGEPVRTRSGYHLVLVNGKRPAYGEVEVSHILIRKPKEGNTQGVKSKIDSIYALLNQGADFETLARQLSEDRRTATNNGYLGFFGIKRYELAFEEAAFGIKEDGEFSEPIETSAGWHIIKRISRKGIQPFPISKRRLEAAIKRDARYTKAQDALVNAILEQGDYQLEEEVLDQYANNMTDTFFTVKWKPTKLETVPVLFKLGGQAERLNAFQAFLQQSTRQRLTLKGKKTPSEAVRSLFEAYLKDYCLKYEEGQLEEKYPEFKALMREYEEGILLFEATKIQVWDKAAQDTSGLEAFYKTIKGKYKWEERVRLTKFSFQKAPPATKIEQVRQDVAELTEDGLFGTFGGENENLEVTTETLEKSKLGAISGLRLEEGYLTEPSKTNEGGVVFYRVEEILPASDKKLDEARGYIIADYQDQLEKEWIQQLKKEYQVEINEEALKSLIGKEKVDQPER